MKTIIKKKTKQKLFIGSSKFALDLAKLVFAGIVLAGVKDLKVNALWYIGLGAVVTVFLASLAFVLFVLGNYKK